MCRICESAATVGQAARELTEALIEQATAERAASPIGGALMRSIPLDTSRPPSLQHQFPRMRRRRD